MFSFLKNKLGKIYSNFTAKVQTLFSKSTIDTQALDELETLLIGADTGIKTTRIIMGALLAKFERGEIPKGSDLKKALEQQLIDIVALQKNSNPVQVYLLVGINGSGKTTSAGKLAYYEKNQGKRVLLVAADTFRAAASEQLEQWAQRSGVDIVRGKAEQEPAAVIYAGCEKFVQDGYDVLIIDTAGRLQTKINLMKELEKIKKVLVRQLPQKNISTLLTIDAMLGQNSFSQAQLFHESTQLDGLILTKLDGTGKGGMIFAIAHELKIPVAFISYGENIDQLKLFEPQEYVKELIETV